MTDKEILSPYIEKVQGVEREVNELVNNCQKELKGHFITPIIKDGRIKLSGLFDIKKLKSS